MRKEWFHPMQQPKTRSFGLGHGISNDFFDPGLTVALKPDSILTPEAPGLNFDYQESFLA